MYNVAHSTVLVNSLVAIFITTSNSLKKAILVKRIKKINKGKYIESLTKNAKKGPAYFENSMLFKEPLITKKDAEIIP